jgi:hypothetical protein
MQVRISGCLPCSRLQSTQKRPSRLRFAFQTPLVSFDLQILLVSCFPLSLIPQAQTHLELTRHPTVNDYGVTNQPTAQVLVSVHVCLSLRS